MSFEFTDERGEHWVFAPSEHFPGKVRIQGPNGACSIPTTVLVRYVGELVRAERKAALEQASTEEILGWPT